MKLDAYASEPHFADHIAAVWMALPAGQRGDLCVATDSGLEDRLAARDIRAKVGLTWSERPILTASIRDLRKARNASREHVALMEHGAGQSYAGEPDAPAAHHGSFAGGKGREADLFLHPNSHSAARDRRVYPKARVEVVGSPILDELPAHEPSGGTVIAVSFHWLSMICPETGAAWSLAYRQAVRRLHYRLLGHGHPREMLVSTARLRPSLVEWYARQGIELVPEFSEVCRRADLLICDNSSALFAFAWTGRPVVVLNSPAYRRSVNHGLRFWDAATVGINVWDARQLPDAIEEALEDAPARRGERRAAVRRAYAHPSGGAVRAAGVLSDWLASLTVSPSEGRAVA